MNELEEQNQRFLGDVLGAVVTRDREGLKNIVKRTEGDWTVRASQIFNILKEEGQSPWGGFPFGTLTVMQHWYITQCHSYHHRLSGRIRCRSALVALLFVLKQRGCMRDMRHLIGERIWAKRWALEWRK